MTSRARIILRAATMLGAVAAVVGGVTYAQFTAGPVTLTGETLASESAGLLVSADNATYGSTEPGDFSFSGIVPEVSAGTGGTASATQTFYLKNTGSSALTLNVMVPTLPTFTVTPTGNVDPTQVFVNLSCNSIIGGTSALSLTTGNDLTTLNGTTGAQMSGSLEPGDTVSCTANVTMGPNVVTTPFSSISSGSFSFAFAGSSS